MTTPSVILFHGTDEFAIAKHIADLQAGLGDVSMVDMNVARFDGRSLNFDDLNTAVNSIPFLAERRLVVLAHPSAAFQSAEARKKFIALLGSISPTTTLALAEHEALKDDHWLLKWARSGKGGVRILVCMSPRRWEMADWIVQESQKQGGRIERGAAERLAEMVGEDTRVAAQEITKLLTYVNFERPVKVQDVEQVSVVSAQESIFDLVDALGNSDGKKAQRVLHRLLESEDPFQVWGMVIRQFRLLLLAREVIEARGDMRAVQKALELRDFVAQKVYKQAQRFSMSALEEIYHRLLEIDEGVKTSQVTLELALDTLVVELVVF